MCGPTQFYGGGARSDVAMASERLPAVVALVGKLEIYTYKEYII